MNRCPRCNHMLFINKTGSGQIEIKCPSCKMISVVTLDKPQPMPTK